MRILFIDFSLPYLLKDAGYPIGGWAVELNAWIKGLRLNEHQVGVLTWKGANNFVGKRLDFDLIETYNPRQGVKIIKYFYSYIPKLQKAANLFEPDFVVQACAGVNTGIMAYIAQRLDKPFIYRAANDMDADQRYKHRLAKYEQWAYISGLRRSSVISCQNEYQYRKFREAYPAKNLHVIHNPHSGLVEHSSKPRNRRQYVAWVGVFQKQKNLPLLYELAEKCSEILFKVAGMPSKTMDNDTEIALAKLKTLSNVEFVGYLGREEVALFLSSAVALVNTSLYEGFSNTYLEAFSVGTPVITPERADPNYIIRDNMLGRSVGKDEDFPVAIREIYNDAQGFEDMSKKCKSYVSRYHDPKTLARQFIELISSTG